MNGFMHFLTVVEADPIAMLVPAREHFRLFPEVLVEVSSESRLVLWAPGDRQAAVQYWDRIGSIDEPQMTDDDSLCRLRASAIRAKQKAPSVLNKLLSLLSRPQDADTLFLPTGEAVEQCDRRRSHLVLVWSQMAKTELHGEQVRSLFRNHNELRQLGHNLWLVSDVQSAETVSQTDEEPEQSRKLAEHFVAKARGMGDRRAEVTALVDLGITELRAADSLTARGHLDQAVHIARRLDMPEVLVDALGHLGLACLKTGDGQLALALIEEELDLARRVRNPFAEKAALDHLSQIYLARGDMARSVEATRQALSLAHSVGDVPHEAELLWLLAVYHAENHQREFAMEKAQAAIALLRTAGLRQADWYVKHLDAYGSNQSERAELTRAVPVTWTATASASVDEEGRPSESGPGVLRMALTATTSMAKFLKSGMRLLPAEVRRGRLEVCEACEHHTGIRCRVCGCFTTAKSALPHEACPIGRWQSV